MADLKISQLTGATTPLAGTEVLPIVQSGSTKQVSVANLTAGRTVGTGAINATGAITLNNSIPLNWKNGSGTTRNVMQLFGNDLYVDNEDGSQIYRTAGYERWRVADASLTFTSTNLVQGTAAKGVNFTANTPAAGMTSQLLNWYEEGTWTATDASGAGLSFTSVTGNYIRVGKSVTAYFSLTYPTTASGNDAVIGGLPFTSSSTAVVPNPGMLTVGYTDSLLSILGVCPASTTSFGLYLNTGSTVTNSQMSAKLIRGVFTYIA